MNFLGYDRIGEMLAATILFFSTISAPFIQQKHGYLNTHERKYIYRILAYIPAFAFMGKNYKIFRNHRVALLSSTSKIWPKAV